MSRKFDRQMELLNCLFSGSRETCANLASRFGVSVKTIKQDIYDLSLYYPIDTYVGAGGGVEMRKGYTINGYLMKKSYLDLISQALINYSKYNDDPEIPQILKLTSAKTAKHTS